MAPQGIKAKWVRIELRKVEIIPGGGEANTFYDFVGPSPVNLWSSPDEYSLLRSVSSSFCNSSCLSLVCVSSKTSHSPYAFLNRYRPRFRWIVKVRDFLNFRFALCQRVGYYIAGIGYELVASVCTKGKRCVTYRNTYFLSLKLFSSQGLSTKSKVGRCLHHFSHHDR